MALSKGERIPPSAKAADVTKLYASLIPDFLLLLFSSYSYYITSKADILPCRSL